MRMENVQRHWLNSDTYFYLQNCASKYSSYVDDIMPSIPADTPKFVPKYSSRYEKFVVSSIHSSKSAVKNFIPFFYFLDKDECEIFVGENQEVLKRLLFRSDYFDEYTVREEDGLEVIKKLKICHIENVFTLLCEELVAFGHTSSLDIKDSLREDEFYVTQQMVSDFCNQIYNIRVLEDLEYVLYTDLRDNGTDADIPARYRSYYIVDDDCNHDSYMDDCQKQNLTQSVSAYMNYASSFDNDDKGV